MSSSVLGEGWECILGETRERKRGSSAVSVSLVELIDGLYTTVPHAGW